MQVEVDWAKNSAQNLENSIFFKAGITQNIIITTNYKNKGVICRSMLVACAMAILLDWSETIRKFADPNSKILQLASYRSSKHFPHA
jgi:hypothetical protein